eukprot:scaffold607_cov160-Ochromonas_danica.AAC.7
MATSIIDTSPLSEALKSLDQLLSERKKEQERNVEEYSRLLEEKKRIGALQDALRALTGVEVCQVSCQNGKGNIAFTLSIQNESYEFLLDNKKRLSAIKGLGDSSKRNFESILQRVRDVAPPNDLRLAVELLAARMS